jgi:hypothetical protein
MAIMTKFAEAVSSLTQQVQVIAVLLVSVLDAGALKVCELDATNVAQFC